MFDQRLRLQVGAAESVDGEGGIALDEALGEGATSNGRRRPRLRIRRSRDHASGAAPLVALTAELSRSRRYGRPLALIGIVPPAGLRRPVDVAAQIRPLVRSTDTVWPLQQCVFVLLPESDRSAAEVVLARLGRARSHLVDRAVTNVAVFPLDALTRTALLEVAGGRPPSTLVEPPASFRRRQARDSSDGVAALPANVPAS